MAEPYTPDRLVAAITEATFTQAPPALCVHVWDDGEDRCLKVIEAYPYDDAQEHTSGMQLWAKYLVPPPARRRKGA